MTHDEHTHTPAGRSPQRVIQRPRVPDRIWGPATARAHDIGRPIGHIIGELLEGWLTHTEMGTPTSPYGDGHTEMPIQKWPSEGGHLKVATPRWPSRDGEGTGDQGTTTPTGSREPGPGGDQDQDQDPDAETSPTKVRRRPRTPGRDRSRHYKAPDDVYEAALVAAHERGMSLGSYIVAQLERLVAEGPSRP